MLSGVLVSAADGQRRVSTFLGKTMFDEIPGEPRRESEMGRSSWWQCLRFDSWEDLRLKRWTCHYLPELSEKLGEWFRCCFLLRPLLHIIVQRRAYLPTGRYLVTSFHQGPWVRGPWSLNRGTVTRRSIPLCDVIQTFEHKRGVFPLDCGILNSAVTVVGI